MITWKIPYIDPKTRICSTCYIKAQHMKRCAKCQATHYCSKQCQNFAWSSHSKYCQAIAKDKEDARKHGQSKAFITKESAFIATLSDAMYNQDSELEMPPPNEYYYVKKDDTNFYLYPTLKQEFIKFKNIGGVEEIQIQDPTFVFYGLDIECIAIKQDP